MANIDLMRSLPPTPTPPSPSPARTPTDDNGTFQNQLERASQPEPQRQAARPSASDSAQRSDSSRRPQSSRNDKTDDKSQGADDNGDAGRSSRTSASSSSKSKPARKADAGDKASKPQPASDSAPKADEPSDDGDDAAQPVAITIHFDPQTIAASGIDAQAVTATAQQPADGNTVKFTPAGQNDGAQALDASITSSASCPTTPATSAAICTDTTSSQAAAANGAQNGDANAQAQQGGYSAVNSTQAASTEDVATTARPAPARKGDVQPVKTTKPTAKGTEGKMKAAANADDAKTQAATQQAAADQADGSDASKPVTPSPVSSGAGDALASQHISPAAGQHAPQPSGPPVSQVPLPEPSALDSGQDEANVGRVVRGLQTAVQQQGGTVSLRLQPPDLGVVRIQLAVQDGVVSARFMTEHDSVRHLLNHQLGALRDALEGHGLVIDRLEVQTLPGQDAGFAQQNAGGGSGFASRQNDLPDDGRSRGQQQQQQTPQSEDGKGSSGNESFADLVDALG